MKNLYLASILSACLAPAATQTDTLLQQYRAMALSYNHDLKAAERNISAGIELEKAAKADLKPKLSGNANFQYTARPIELEVQLPSISTPIAIQGRNTQYGASVTLLQPIYTGGRIVENIRMAQHQTSLATNQREKLKADILYQTDILYWNTVARRELVGIATDYRNSIAALVETIGQRVEVSLTNPQDLLMAQVKLNDAEFHLLQAQKEWETGRMALNSLIGATLSQATQTPATVPITTATNHSEVSFNTRPEIRMAHDQIQMAQSTLKQTDARYKPQLYIGVDGSYSSPGYDFRADLDPNYALYAKVSVPLFEWGKRRNEKRASTQRIDMARDRLNATRDAVDLETQTARTALARAIEQIELSRAALEKAIKNEQMANERYNEGNISIVEVIESQTYRQTAQINFVQAKTAAQGQQAALMKALNSY